MAIIVRHVSTKKKYILIGGGFGAYKTNKSRFIANQLPKLDEGEEEMAAVCDKSGKVKWFGTDEIEIINVDGKDPKEILK